LAGLADPLQLRTTGRVPGWQGSDLRQAGGGGTGSMVDGKPPPRCLRGAGGGGSSKGNEWDEFKPRGAAGSVLAQQRVDAALKLTLLPFALAQPLPEVGDRRLMGPFRTERDADKIVAPPDDAGEEAAGETDRLVARALASVQHRRIPR